MKKNWKAENQKQKFYLYQFFYHFFPPVHNCIAWTNQKFHFESCSLLQKFLGKSVKSKKMFESEKRKAKVEKIIEKLKAKKAKSSILKTASKKWKLKFYDFVSNIRCNYHLLLIIDCYKNGHVKDLPLNLKLKELWNYRMVQFLFTQLCSRRVILYLVILYVSSFRGYLTYFNQLEI